MRTALYLGKVFVMLSSITLAFLGHSCPVSSEYVHLSLTASSHLLACRICYCDLSQGGAEVHPTPATLFSHPALPALLVPADIVHFISTLTFLGQAL